MSVEPKKWGVIYNPKAGTRKVKKRWKEIKEYMDSKGVDYDYVQSEGFGSVERLAKILANNGYRTIVIVGGDGALNDAINGIMLSDAEDKENIALGMIKTCPVCLHIKGNACIRGAKRLNLQIIHLIFLARTDICDQFPDRQVKPVFFQKMR